ncbi:MAG TPA: hypothetical protein VGI48_13935 [Caldimonas sp.]|jgi:Na+-driven multidrug efflux pump
MATRSRVSATAWARRGAESPKRGSDSSAAIRACFATGVGYLRVVGPSYGFFGLGLALYFASQGAGRLAWPLLAGLLRMLVAVGGGWLAVTLSGSLLWGFVIVALALVTYGVTIVTAIANGVWFRH